MVISSPERLTTGTGTCRGGKAPAAVVAAECCVAAAGSAVVVSSSTVPGSSPVLRRALTEQECFDLETVRLLNADDLAQLGVTPATWVAFSRALAEA